MGNDHLCSRSTFEISHNFSHNRGGIEIATGEKHQCRGLAVHWSSPFFRLFQCYYVSYLVDKKSYTLGIGEKLPLRKERENRS